MLEKIKMTTPGEAFSDGIGKCPACGSINLIVEVTSYYYIEREEDDDTIIINNEYEGNFTDEKIVCKECGKEVVNTE